MSLFVSKQVAQLSPRGRACFVSISSSTDYRAQSFIIVTSASDLPLRTIIKCCSVVFGVTLMLLVINTSSLPPVKNKHRHLPATSVSSLPRSVAAMCIALDSRAVHSTWLRIAIFAYPTCIRCPL